MVTGHGAGFVMCWRNGVRWDIHRDDDAKKFMSVSSGEYVLAIPDYSHQARENSARITADRDSISSSSTYRNGAMFKKVIMKLSGNVRWLAGLVFERDLAGKGRSFDFIPHYNVALTTPDRATSSEGKVCNTHRTLTIADAEHSTTHTAASAATISICPSLLLRLWTEIGP